MVRRKGLGGGDHAVVHITHGDGCARRLFVDKFRDAAELQAEAVSGIVVDQNEKLQSGTVSLKRDPACHFILQVALIHFHVSFCDHWHFCAAVRLHRHDHFHRDIG